MMTTSVRNDVSFTESDLDIELSSVLRSISEVSKRIADRISIRSAVETGKEETSNGKKKRVNTACR